MPLANYDFHVDQGGTFATKLNYVDASNNNSFSSAVSAEGQVRPEPYSNTNLATINCTFSTDSSNNDTLTIKLAPTDTQSFVPILGKVLYYDIKVTFNDASEVFILGGKLFINFTVTRP